MADIPDALGGLLKVAERVGGEVIVFDHQDKIAYACPRMRERYQFLEDGDTFEDLFWGIIKCGMSDAETLRISPYDYFKMIRVSRRANDRLDFTKSYRTDAGIADLLCHHRRAGEWSAQLRVDVSRLTSGGGDYYTPSPDCVAEVSVALAEAATLSALVDRLPTGVVVTDAAGKIRWMNAAASAALDTGHLVISDGYLHHRDPSVAVRLADAVADASRAECDSFTVSLGDSPVSVSHGVEAGTALVLLPPTPCDHAALACLRSLGLSPAIAETALAVVQAGGPAEAAEVTGKALTTIRRQLTRAYDALGGSLGIKSQRALAHLIGQIAAIQPWRQPIQPITWGHAPQHKELQYNARH